MPHRLRRHWPLGALLSACFLAALPARADDRKADDKVAKLYHRLLRSSLWVGARGKAEAEGKASWHTGSGALIDLKNRYVLTNWHVVQEEDIVFVCFPTYAGNVLVQDRKFYLNVLQKGGGGRGKVVARDSKRDLALIQMEVVPQGALALSMAKEGVKTGDRVHSIGNPGAEDKLWICTSRTVQEVSPQKLLTMKDGVERRYEAKMILTDVPSKEGESGGPLIDDRGDLVGVTQGYRVETQQGIYVDLSEVKDFLDKNGLLAKVLASTAPPKEPAKPTEPVVSKPPEKPPAKPAAKADEKEKEKEAERKLRFAKNLAEAGKIERAVEVLDDVMKNYPGTIAADQAQRLRKSLK